MTDYLDTAYTASYTYNDYNQLSGVSIGGSNARNYSYDLWGNVTAVSVGGGNSATYNYAVNGTGAPTTNRIASVTTGGTTINYGYDAAGNLTQEGALSYSYDAANRLKEVGTGGNNTYGYDGDGHRVKKVESGGGAIYYVWSSVLKEVAMEINSQGGVHRAYVYAGKQLAGALGL